MLRLERPPASRVREIRMHGLKGALPSRRLTKHLRKGRVYQCHLVGAVAWLPASGHP